MNKEFLKIDNRIPIGEQFLSIANTLFNRAVIFSPKYSYRITEIEFYYFNHIQDNHLEDLLSYLPLEAGVPYLLQDYYNGFCEGYSHQDIFTHKDIKQQQLGFWYLHSKGAKLKNGKRKGLDLTFGVEEINSYGGILIRGLKNIGKDNEYIYGPSSVVNKFISDLNGHNVDDIHRIQSISALGSENPILIDKYELPFEKVHSCERFGLKVKKQRGDASIELQQTFLHKNYRYFIYPLIKHSGKENIMRSWDLQKKYPTDEILNLFGRKHLP